MALLQIAEPDMSLNPHNRNIVVGIDLGTTNSLVATVKSGMPTILTTIDGERLIPSVVNYSNSAVVVGQAAVLQRLAHPSDTIVSVKRFMGLSLDDLDKSINYPYKFLKHSSQIQISTSMGSKNPVEVSADILRYLNQLAVEALGNEISGAVITVPAYFDDAKRLATKHAAELAGLHVLRLLNEPTAAAIAYGLDSRQEGTFLVYDLGGGTFDVSVLRFHKGVFEVLAVNGDTNLGGDDFDQRLFLYISEKANLGHLNDADTTLVLMKSREVKEQLSSNDQVALDIVLSDKKNINLVITSDEFNQLVAPLVQKTLIPLKKALRDAKLSKDQIDEVIMVGGSTRLKAVRQMVSEFFAKELLTTINPDEVVAIGASIQADILAGNTKEDMLLLDVTPLSLGVETMGGLIEKIIPRNSTIPIARAQEFTTYQDGQTAMTIHVVQGERELVNDCRSLAKFTLRGIPPMLAGQARVRITYQIDTDGLLIVTATEVTSGTLSQIEVKPSYGLSPDEIQKMLHDSIEFANLDMANRMYHEAVIDAKSLLESVEYAIITDYLLLSNNEIEDINTICSQLNGILSKHVAAKDYDLISTKIRGLTTELNKVTADFAAKRMNKNIQDSLSGKSMDEVLLKINE